MTTTVARLLADSLEAHDVDQIFCVPGESYVGLTSVLAERNSIRMIVCRHEGGAGFMAVADGRLRNRAGVCIVSRGPGLSNAMVSLHSAFHDATPMVMMVGQVERKDFGRLALQEQNYSKLLSDITKSVIEVNEPEQASEAIARAFHIAESGTPGPVAVILPEDIFDESTDAVLNLPRPRVVAGPRTQDLERLAAMLANAERPLILVGGALLADSLHEKGGLCRPATAVGAMGPADQPHPSPPAIVRRTPSQLRRLHGHPRPARADRRNEEGGPDRCTRRASDRYRQPVLHIPRRTAAASCRWSTSGPMRTRSAASGAPTWACRAIRMRWSKACWR